MEKAAHRGILILADMHRARQDEAWDLWYNKRYSYEDLKAGWRTLLAAFKHHWNLFGGWVGGWVGGSVGGWVG
jgi:hypothetical protein